MPPVRGYFSKENQVVPISWSPPGIPRPVPPVMRIRRKRAVTAARRGRRGRLVRDVIWMAHMHHPVDRTADHVFQNGPWTDRPTVPIIVRIPFDPEIAVIPSLITIHGGHSLFPRAPLPLAGFVLFNGCFVRHDRNQLMNCVDIRIAPKLFIRDIQPFEVLAVVFVDKTAFNRTIVNLGKLVTQRSLKGFLHQVEFGGNRLPVGELFHYPVSQGFNKRTHCNQ